MSARPDVEYGPPAHPAFARDCITDTAGHTLSGGSGASCWGYNQSNIVRHGDCVYALSWRDDLSLRVYCRRGDGPWRSSPPLPPVPQNGNVLADGAGRAHVIGGDGANWHAVFGEAGDISTFRLLRHAEADSRFGACVGVGDRIFVAGGLGQMAWYVLQAADDWQPAARGGLPHPRQRGYNFTLLEGKAGHAFSSDDYFVPGEHFPNQRITRRDPQSGALETVETPRGIYPVLKTYYYYNPDLFAAPDDWRLTVVSDVSDTYTPEDGGRGTTEQQDLLADGGGLVHLVYFENRQRAHSVWAGREQDASRSRLYHAVGPPGGPFEHFCLGAFNSGRLYQTPDGRMHYLLTRGARGRAKGLYYAYSEPGQWHRISRPVPLDMPGPFWHLYISTRRAGGTLESFIDCYWTGAYGADSNVVWYGRLEPPDR